MDDCAEFLALDSWNCATEAVVDTVQRIEGIGLSQYQEFVTEVIVDRSRSIHQPIKNSLPLLKRQFPRVVTKSKLQASSLKSDCNLFSRLYIASNFRDGNLRSFSLMKTTPGHPPFLNMGNSIFLLRNKIY